MNGQLFNQIATAGNIATALLIIAVGVTYWVFFREDTSSKHSSGLSRKK